MEKIWQRMEEQGGVSACDAGRVLRLSVGFVFVLGVLSISLTGHHGGIRGRGGDEKARGTEASSLSAVSRGFVPTAARHGRAADDIVPDGRSLLGKASSASLKVQDPSLITGQRVALAHEPETPFNVANETRRCGNIIRNLVVDSPHNILYYILEEKCIESGGIDTHLRQSFRLADLRNASAGGGTGNELAEEKVVSYWWQANDPIGPAPSTATVVGNQATAVVMTRCDGMDVSPSGSHLVLGLSARPPYKTNVALLSTSDGSRSSITTEATGLTSLAFNPNGSRVYAVESTSAALTLRSAAVMAEGDVPLSAESSFEEDASILKNSNPSFLDMAFGHESFDPEGYCLYFVDTRGNRVWGIDLSSTAEMPIAVAGSGTRGADDGDQLVATFDTPTAVAVTPDGCNLFVSQLDGKVRWVKLDSPCQLAKSVQTVASYSSFGLQGLTLRANASPVRAYVGSADGHVFELEINQTQLHHCSRPTQPPILSGSLPSPSISLPPPEPQPPVTPSSSQPSPLSRAAESGTRSSVVIRLVVPILSAAIAAFIVGAMFFYFKSYCASPEPPPQPAGVTVFTYAQLLACTNGFHESNSIGQRGAFGTVYRGWIQEQQVAVKIMHGDLTEVKRKQFEAEKDTLSVIHHSNLVQLIGYCNERGKLMLVYPYIQGGSLFSRLHDKLARAQQPPLTLLQRIKIAVDIAEGLRYLHHSLDKPIIHRDVKSANVLLQTGAGRNIKAVLADFGLATIVQKMFGQPEEAVVTTLHIAGTAGYMPHECCTSMKLSVKTDVYAFGVIVLELLTGRKALVRNKFDNNASPLLVEWVKSMTAVTEDETVPLDLVVDECLQAEIQTSVWIREIVQFTFEVAMRCAAHDDNERPTMADALHHVRRIHTRVRNLTLDR